MLPNPMEDIARRLVDYEKRLSHLERLEGGPGNIWLDAGSFGLRVGIPNYTELVGVGGIANQGITAWALSPTATEIVGTNMRVPDNMTIIALDFYYAMRTAVAGNIVAGFVTNAMAVGESAANNSTAAPPNVVVIAVPGVAQQIAVQTINPSIAITAGDVLGVNARRTGGDGNDTATGDCLFLGAHIRMT